MTDEHKLIKQLMESEEIKKRCEPDTLGPLDRAGEYLRNRIWKTLLDGIQAGRQLERQEIVSKVSRFLDANKETDA